VAATLPGGPPRSRPDPIDAVSACSKARPATSTGGRAALSGSATPSDAGPSGVLRTAILHVERSPDRIAAAERRRHLSLRRTGDAGTDSQRANQTLRGMAERKRIGREAAKNGCAGCDSTSRRRTAPVKSVPRSPRFLCLPRRTRTGSIAPNARPIRRCGARGHVQPLDCNCSIAAARSGHAPFENRCCKDQTVTALGAQILSRIARIHVVTYARADDLCTGEEECLRGPARRHNARFDAREVRRQRSVRQISNGRDRAVVDDLPPLPFSEEKGPLRPEAIGQEIGRTAGTTRSSENDELRRASGTAASPLSDC
jgi:hypothetical protein